jgi:hypothetical protein
MLLLCILLFFINIVPANTDTSNKRGLVYLYADPSSSDVDWDSEQSDLTWYYNYGSTPSDNIDGSKLQFVPVSALFGTLSGGVLMSCRCSGATVQNTRASTRVLQTCSSLPTT